MILFGKRVLADVIKDLEMRSSWIIWMGSQPNDKYPPKRKERDVTQSDTEKGCEEGGRDGSGTHVSQQMPRAAGNPQKLGERQQVDLPSGPPEGITPVRMSSSDFWPPEL